MIIDKAFVCLTCETCVQPVEVDNEVLNVTCPNGCGQVILSVNPDPGTARFNLLHYLLEEESPDGPLGDAHQHAVWTFHQSLDNALQYLTQYGDLFRVKEN